MTVRVERVVDVPAPPADVWAFISDPANRARAISFVEEFAVADDGGATWELSLPIPLVDRRITVETEERERDPPHAVTFVGRSRVFAVEGEHRLEPIEGGTRLTNRFVVDGKLPGVETFFERNIEDEFDNLEAALSDDLGVTL